MKTSAHFNSNFRVLKLRLQNNLSYFITFLMIMFSINSVAQQNQNITLDSSSPVYINETTLGRSLVGGDTIFISSDRDKPLRFQSLIGSPSNPIVVVNKGGQVKIDGVAYGLWGALTFENCQYVKVSGKGHPGFKYGFELSALQSGLSFTELSSDCEAENIKISHDGFFGIFAKKDYGGNPPNPAPIFNNLVIHDCFIENVSEGMYIGETKSPGMEFKNLSIYNNIIRNTQRESIQVANATENVQIYNNTMINAGLEGLSAHGNNLQIGDNSVASVYNNIMMTAPYYGVINFGMGNVFVYNNYFESNKGVFLDNRLFSDPSMLMEVSQNYFSTTIGGEVIRNMNEVNNFIASNNTYNTDITFYYDLNNVDNESLSNNNFGTVAGIQFTDVSENDYSLATGTASEYLGMGAPGGPEYFDYDEPEPDPSPDPVTGTISQIVVTPTMVTDEVSGGSVDSPLYLFDEQSIDVDANEEPTSISWKPYYNENNAPYHTVVDLGTEYQITQINLHDMHATNNFDVEYYDGSTWVALFTDPCDNFKVWKRHNVNVVTTKLRFSMYTSPYAAVNEIIIYGSLLVKEPQQIVIDSSMVTDLVNNGLKDGSVDSPLYLFDEQDVDPELNEHPVSKNWKPYYNNTMAPYYASVDLGQEYHITKIYIHDTHSTYDFNIEVETESGWTHLLTEPCDSYQVWKLHEVDVDASKLRLSMLDSPYAGVNEIIIYGYPTNNDVRQSKNLPVEEKQITVLESDNQKPVLYPNPVRDNINLRIPNVNTLEKQKVQIFDLSGNLIYNMDVDMNNPTSVIQLNANEIMKSSGLYLLRYENDKGVEETIKFYKI
jgi:hypothetical protein